jgi:hypothetical protein
MYATHFSSFFNTRLSKFCFPLPGGPVKVMNVEGYSDNHLSTLFSASTRSRQAFWPTRSESGPLGPLEEEEWNIDNDWGSLNL